MYFSAKQFREDCVVSQINHKETLRELKNKGVLIHSGNKRISKGMKIASSAVHCLTFDCSGEDFIDMEELISTEEPKEKNEN